MSYETKHGVCTVTCKSAIEVCDYIDGNMLDVNSKFIGIVYKPLEMVYELFFIKDN